MRFSGTFKKLSRLRAKTTEAAPTPIENFELFGIGRNNKNQLGITPTETNINFIEVTDGLKWVDMAPGTTHGILLNVSGEVWGMGETAFGQLGIQTNNSATSIPLRVGVESDFKFIFSKFATNYGIKTDGTIWGIGNGSGYVLGVGVSSGNWVQLSGDTNWVDCAIGQNHVVALKSDGTMWGRGMNTTGQLAFPIQSSAIPVWRQMGSTITWKAVGAGAFNSYGISISGNVYATGENTQNQSGANPTTPKIAMTLVGNSNNTEKLVASQATAWILKTDGTIWALGSSSGGQSGPGGNKAAFTQLGTDNDWVDIQSGLLNMYAKKTDGTWWGIGYNLNGEFGVSAPTSFSAFTQVTFDANTKLIRGGQQWAWALR